MDEELGLCYLRVQTWCPFCLQFYYNGHSWLANELKANRIEFEMVVNAFAHISDFEKANELAKKLDVRIGQKMVKQKEQKLSTTEHAESTEFKGIFLIFSVCSVICVVKQVCDLSLTNTKNWMGNGFLSV